MHVANIKPKKKWTDIETLVTEAIGETGEIDPAKKYELTNNGGANVCIVSQLAAPAENVTGLIVPAGKSYKYVGGTNMCYLKSGGACDVHIEEIEG